MTFEKLEAQAKEIMGPKNKCHWCGNPTPCEREARERELMLEYIETNLWQSHRPEGIDGETKATS